MKKVRLIHWNKAEAEKKAALIRKNEYDVIFEQLDRTGLNHLKKNPPDVVIIDLDRMPSQGRDLAITIRKFKTTRYVPIIFMQGDPKKIVSIQKILPDAHYSTWKVIKSALKQAILHPPQRPVVPNSVFEGYKGTPLPKKLGIKKESVVILTGAPKGIETTLEPLPPGVTLRRRAQGKCDLILWFVKSIKEMEQKLKKMGDLAGKDGLWIIWPKKTSSIASDLNQTIVREKGFAAGLVDYKVCAIDNIWSGLKFTKRK